MSETYRPRRRRSAMFDGAPTLLTDEELEQLKREYKDGTPRVEIQALLREALRAYGTRTE